MINTLIIIFLKRNDSERLNVCMCKCLYSLRWCSFRCIRRNILSEQQHFSNTDGDTITCWYLLLQPSISQKGYIFCCRSYLKFALYINFDRKPNKNLYVAHFIFSKSTFCYFKVEHVVWSEIRGVVSWSMILLRSYFTGSFL